MNYGLIGACLAISTFAPEGLGSVKQYGKGVQSRLNWL